MSLPLTLAAALALATTCQHSVDPRTLVGIATHESGLVVDQIHVNQDGSRDVGLMQVNERNFDLLGLDMTAALQPCRNIAAAAHLLTLFSRYNTGSPSRGIANGYAPAVWASIRTVEASVPTPSPASPTQSMWSSIEDEPEQGN